MSVKGMLLRGGILTDGENIDLFRGDLKLAGKSRTPGSTAVLSIHRDSSGNILLATGTTVPGAEAGFAKGCVFIKTDAATGVDGTYFNIGTTTAASFVTASGQTAAQQGADGLVNKQVARATYDFSVHGGAISTIGLGVTLPDNAIITRSWYEVITTLTSTTGPDDATVAIGLPTDDVGGIVAAIAINDVGNPWDAGLHEGIQDGTVAAFSVKTTAAREISVDIAVDPVTAGKFIVFCEYVVTE